MLSREQFLSIAAQLKVANRGLFEKDYALSCLLDSFIEVEPLSTKFVFKGGTALRKVYFSDWRYSEDLDFSVLPGFPAERFREFLEKVFAIASRKYGLSLTVKNFHQANGMIRVRVQYRGPLDFLAAIYLDVTLDEPILIAPARRTVFALFTGSPTPNVLVYSLEEILAEKLRSLLERGKARDFYDVWRLLKEKRGNISMKSLFSVFEQKCLHKGIRYDGIRRFLAPEVIEPARSYWDRDLRQYAADLPTYEKLIEELRRQLEFLSREYGF